MIPGYAILLVPQAVVRLMQFGNVNVHIHNGISIAFAAWFGLTGAVESLLFVIFRPDFGLELPVPGRRHAQAHPNGSNHLQSDRSMSPPIP